MINVFWFRRDLRLDDNTALDQALLSELPLLTIFIFDTNIIEELKPDDSRISFIYSSLVSINNELAKSGSAIQIFRGDPAEIWKRLIKEFRINSVFINKDYEPYAIKRDEKIGKLLSKNNIRLNSFKDQVVFEEDEVVKPDKKPYTTFTPYKSRWLFRLKESLPFPVPQIRKRGFFHKFNSAFPSLGSLGFSQSQIKVKPYDLSVIRDYDKFRDIPAADRTTHLSPHLRFGTVSIRKIADKAVKENNVFLSELIWREFFMQILFHFPGVVSENFRSKYDNIQWINNQKDFERWCNGETGYPMVDAGMRQLNETGYMHNRVRMITAGFLCKQLVIDWRWGEAWFAQKLLDYELSSNNGNWQWAAGTGSDAVPYFRIFNPVMQQLKFDPEKEYIRRWVVDFDKPSYPKPMIDHDYARNRAFMIYKAGIMK